MTTTNKPQLKRVERPIDAKGPIDTLKVQKVKLEQALNRADERVAYKQHTLQEALNRRDEIMRDLSLTEQILAQHTPQESSSLNHPTTLENSMMTSVVNTQEAGEAFARRFVPRTFL